MEGQNEVRLKKLEEYRGLLEKPEQFLLIPAEEVGAGLEGDAEEQGTDRTSTASTWRKLSASSRLKAPASSMSCARTSLLFAAQEQRFGQPTDGPCEPPRTSAWALTPENLAEAVEENYFEIWNGHPGVDFPRRCHPHGTREECGNVANTLRIAKLKAPPLYGVGADDAHRYHGESSSPGRGSGHGPRQGELEAGTLIKAMRAGDFSASSGVLLEGVKFINGALSIRIQAKPGVTYTTKIIGTPVDYDRATMAQPLRSG